MSIDVLDEAYERLHDAGPEWGADRLTNHGPMAVEVLVRTGHAEQVHSWLDDYLRRLDELPTASDPITDWRAALGSGRRVGDWSVFFERELAEAPWRDVLGRWWPRLLPGIAAGASHGLIRTSHAVRALLRDPSAPAVGEFGRALAFWAARSLAVPPAPTVGGDREAADLVPALPRIPDPSGQIAVRFGQVAALADWPGAVGSLRPTATPADVRDRLGEIVTAASAGYLHFGAAAPVLLVHASTAPNAVLYMLPALPESLWQTGLDAVWALSAALVSSYAPPYVAAPFTGTAPDPDDVLDRAVAHGDEHVIKFTDCAVQAFGRSGDARTLVAAERIATLIAEP